MDDAHPVLHWQWIHMEDGHQGLQRQWTHTADDPRDLQLQWIHMDVARPALRQLTVVPRTHMPLPTHRA